MPPGAVMVELGSDTVEGEPSLPPWTLAPAPTRAVITVSPAGTEEVW